ncbi:Tic22 family protein, partial [Fischerella thermalis]
MKSLVRWGTTLGLVGSTLLATVFSGNAPVLALPDQQITEKLNEVPVFLITNPQGVPLTRTLPPAQNGQKSTTVADVFMNGQEAQNFLEQLRKQKDPKLVEMVKTLQVKPVPMGVVYQKLREDRNKPDRVLFALQPGQQDLQGAITLLRQKGQEVKGLIVPVFIVQSADKGYVSVKRKSNNQEIVPLFLSQKDAQGLLNQVKKDIPKAEIQVVDIEGVIQTLQQKNDEWLKQVTLVPSSESLEYISKQPRTNAPNTVATPNLKPNNAV